jgi:hypothetical protein
MCQYFMAVLLDMEGDEGRAAVVLKAQWSWGYGSWRWLLARRLLRVSGVLRLR